MKSHVIWTNFDVFALFLATLNFQAASRQSGMTFFDPKPLQIASLLRFRKSQEFSGKVSEVCGENFRDIAI